MASHEDLITSISALKLKPHGRFSPKLDFDQRCEILALFRTGVGRAVLAEAYGLDRRTVTHIYNRASPHYRNVRAEEQKLGKEEFMKKYITENGLNKLKAATERMPKPPVEEPKGPRANRNSRKFAGVHKVKNDNVAFEHRIIVSWQEATLDNAGAGWYYQDADGSQPNDWLHNGDESRMSSKACIDAVRANLFDV